MADSSDTTTSGSEAEGKPSKLIAPPPTPARSLGGDGSETPPQPTPLTTMSHSIPMGPPPPASSAVVGQPTHNVTLSSDDDDDGTSSTIIKPPGRVRSGGGGGGNTTDPLANIDTQSDRSFMIHSEVDTDMDVPGWRVRGAFGGAGRGLDETTQSFATCSVTSRDTVRPSRGGPRQHVGCQTTIMQTSTELTKENEDLRVEIERLNGLVQKLESSLYRFAAEKAEWSAREEERKEREARASSTTPNIDPSVVTELQNTLREKTEVIEMLLAERTKLLAACKDDDVSNASLASQTVPPPTTTTPQHTYTPSYSTGSMGHQRTSTYYVGGGGGGVTTVPPHRATSPAQSILNQPQPPHSHHTTSTMILPCAMCVRLEAELGRVTTLLEDTRTHHLAVYAAMRLDKDAAKQELLDLRTHLQWVYGLLQTTDMKTTMERFTIQLQVMMKGHLQAMSDIVSTHTKRIASVQQNGN
eukprot:PhF_6_TR16976/c0_g1_i1/m.25666